MNQRTKEQILRNVHDSKDKDYTLKVLTIELMVDIRDELRGLRK